MNHTAGDDDQIIVLFQRGVLFHDAFYLFHDSAFRLNCHIEFGRDGNRTVNPQGSTHENALDELLLE